MISEFKLGDKVKTLCSIGVDETIPIGTIGTVHTFDSSGYVDTVYFEHCDDWFWVTEEDIELVKNKSDEEPVKESLEKEEVITLGKTNKTVRDNVEMLMIKYPELRNNDKALELKYWEEIDGCRMDTVKNFTSDFIKKSTPPVTIVRARRLIQEEGNLMPTDEKVLIRRWHRALAMEQSIRDEREV